MEAVLCVLKPGGRDAQGDWLEAEHPAVVRLSAARRPLLLSEVVRPEGQRPIGMERFFMMDSVLSDVDWLLAPVRAQGLLIGILVLGEHEDKQPYASPDIEAAQLLVARFSSVLETARLCVRASQHAALLNSLYTVATMPNSTFETISEAASAYAMVAANATSAQVEIWEYDQRNMALHYCTAAGHYSHLLFASEEEIVVRDEGDWNSWFFNGEIGSDWAQAGAPACLLSFSRCPDCSFAWLPLQKNGHVLGALLLLYPRPHRFTRVERRVLEMFADQCSTTLENVRMALDLRMALERQKELDMLKDRFITTASHELRTPLTAVQGYIELLCEHKDKLSPQMIIDFAEKARRGCDELALLVSNIVDANSLHSDIENIHLDTLSLYQAVLCVLDILGISVTDDGSRVSVDVDPELMVTGDKGRVHQVLLNLLTNALRYSPADSPIKITGRSEGQVVRLAIRDYGAGIPSELQKHLFERFVRLERDMNSTVRGAGLGLYLCKQLIEAMGGQIWVESSGEPGEGSTFLFELQLVPHNQLPGSLLLQLPV
jgi:signal transduction histidine kinase